MLGILNDVTGECKRQKQAPQKYWCHRFNRVCSLWSDHTFHTTLRYEVHSLMLWKQPFIAAQTVLAKNPVGQKRVFARLSQLLTTL